MVLFYWGFCSHGCSPVAVSPVANTFRAAAPIAASPVAPFAAAPIFSQIVEIEKPTVVANSSEPELVIQIDVVHESEDGTLAKAIYFFELFDTTYFNWGLKVLTDHLEGWSRVYSFDPCY